MKIPITCSCGQTLHIAIEDEGKWLPCSRCGAFNVMRIPIAETPKPLTPEWVIVPILAFLMLANVAIVLAGWWGARAYPGQPLLGATLEVRPLAVAMPAVEHAILEEVSAEARPKSTAVVLPRTVRTEDDDPPSLVPVKPAPHVAPEPEKPHIAWALDSPKVDKDRLMAPIETTKIEKGALHYSLRRLALDGEARFLKLAVTPAAHDDIQSVLMRMGDGYRFTTLKNREWLSYAALKNFDVVFLTCADVYAQDFQAVLPLRKFVEQGGTLYASDLRGDIVLAAFPEFRARVPMAPGVTQDVEARVVDKGLQSYLHRKAIPLTFDAPGWRPAAFDPTKVTVCLEGEYRNQLGQTQTAPLLVKFRFKQGNVIFTSFHHSKNDSEIVRRLLDYLVFASVNARSEARVRDLMRRYEFAPEAMRPALLNRDKKAESSFQHAGGGLQIALGFEPQGAKLKLTLKAPDGNTIEHEDQGIFLIEIQKAAKGAWSYAVTPIELPHGNFPILVAAGAQTNPR